MVSTAYLPAAHDSLCPVFREVAVPSPPWMASPEEGS